MIYHTLLAVSHVPTYDGCISGCCTPPHHHSTSQVIYVRGSGGLEVHLDSLTKPFDILGGEILDVDAVFKHEYDPSTYDLFMGCGGCVSDVDAFVTDPIRPITYEPGVVESFTQHSYRSVFKKESRKFNASKLLECDQGHFTIRVRDFGNRTDGAPLIWGAVIGLAESFTFAELVSFPIFVLKNHGDSWNELGWTVYVTGLFTWLGWWLGRWLAMRLFGMKLLSPFDAEMVDRPRAWLYDVALISFGWAALEMFVHPCYAQSMAHFGHEFWVGFVGVILIGNGVPAIITAVTWWGVYHPNWIITSPVWIPLELASAFSYLFFFGAGFFVGPAAVFLAALVRIYETFVPSRGIPYVPLMQQKAVVVTPEPEAETPATASLPAVFLSDRPA